MPESASDYGVPAGPVTGHKRRRPTAIRRQLGWNREPLAPMAMGLFLFRGQDGATGSGQPVQQLLGSALAIRLTVGPGRGLIAGGVLLGIAEIASVEDRAIDGYAPS